MTSNELGFSMAHLANPEMASLTSRAGEDRSKKSGVDGAAGSAASLWRDTFTCTASCRNRWGEIDELIKEFSRVSFSAFAAESPLRASGRRVIPVEEVVWESVAFFR